MSRLISLSDPLCPFLFIYSQTKKIHLTSPLPICARARTLLIHLLSPWPAERSRALGLEDERGADLVSDGRVLGASELGSVEGKTQGSLDTWSESLGVAEAEDTDIVDLGLDEGGVVEVSLGSDLEVDLGAVVGRLGVVGGSCSSLDVSVDSVVVGSRVGRQVAQAVEGDGVVWGVVAGSDVVPGDLGALDVVRGLSTSQEAVTSDNSISSESRALEEVQVLTGVEAWLLVSGREESVLGLLVWQQGRDELELETLGNVVLELNVVAENVGGGPGLSQGKAVLAVVELGLEVTVDVSGLGVSETGDLEGDAVGGLGLDLERGAVDVVVLVEEVTGGLAEVLPGGGNRLLGCHCCRAGGEWGGGVGEAGVSNGCRRVT